MNTNNDIEKILNKYGPLIYPKNPGLHSLFKKWSSVERYISPGLIEELSQLIESEYRRGFKEGTQNGINRAVLNSDMFPGEFDKLRLASEREKAYKKGAEEFTEFLEEYAFTHNELPFIRKWKDRFLAKDKPEDL